MAKLPLARLAFEALVIVVLGLLVAAVVAWGASWEGAHERGESRCRPRRDRWRGAADNRLSEGNGLPPQHRGGLFCVVDPWARSVLQRGLHQSASG